MVGELAVMFGQAHGRPRIFWSPVRRCRSSNWSGAGAPSELGQQPANPTWMRDLAASCDRIGKKLVAQGDVPGAFAMYRASLTVALQIVVARPERQELRRALSVSYEHMGDLRRDENDLDGALEGFRSGREIMRKLVAENPTTVLWQSDLAVCRDRIGEIQAARTRRTHPG
jgi:hypothetical protein